MSQKDCWTVALMFMKLLIMVNVNARSLRPLCEPERKSLPKPLPEHKCTSQLMAELDADLRSPDAKSALSPSDPKLPAWD